MGYKHTVVYYDDDNGTQSILDQDSSHVFTPFESRSSLSRLISNVLSGSSM